jgi:hypothetical protein
LLLGGCAQPQAISCAAPLKPAIEVDLYFGRNIAGGGEVSDSDWASFLATEVTSRFPDGLSVVDMAGQWRGPSGEISRERSKMLVIIVFDAPAHGAKVQAIIDAYLKRFRQREVLRTERPLCAA